MQLGWITSCSELFAAINESEFFVWFFRLFLYFSCKVFNVFIIALFMRSQSPSPIGWQRVERDCLIPVSSLSHSKNVLPNSLPWSCEILWENLKSRKYLLKRISAAALSDLFVVGNDCAYFEKWSATTYKYLYCPLHSSIANNQYKLVWNVTLILYD